MRTTRGELEGVVPVALGCSWHRLRARVFEPDAATPQARGVVNGVLLVVTRALRRPRAEAGELGRLGLSRPSGLQLLRCEPVTGRRARVVNWAAHWTTRQLQPWMANVFGSG